MSRQTPSNRLDWAHAQLSYHPDAGRDGWQLSVPFSGRVPTRSRNLLVKGLQDEISTQGFVSADVYTPEDGAAASTLMITFNSSHFLDVDPASFKGAITDTVDEILDQLEEQRATESRRVDSWLQGLGSHQLLSLEVDLPSRRPSAGS